VSELVIAEGVELELRPARLASRCAALLLDFAVQAVLALLLHAVVFQGIWRNSNADSDNAFWIVIIVIVTLGYPVAIETLTVGRSIGKLALGLRIVRVDGGPERFRHALARALAGLFADINLPMLAAVVLGESSPLWLILVGTPGAFASVASRRGQRIGDLLAGTIAIRERNVTRFGALPVLPSPALLAWAERASVGEVPAGLVVAARQLISRVFELDRPAAARLATELAGQVSAYVTPAAPPGTPAYLYLVAVTGERFRRETGGPLVGMTPFSPMPMAYGAPMVAMPPNPMYGNGPGFGGGAPVPGGPMPMPMPVPMNEAGVPLNRREGSRARR
jgi:uncharacterized RDD family membrane protein YckC